MSASNRPPIDIQSTTTTTTATRSQPYFVAVMTNSPDAVRVAHEHRFPPYEVR